MPITFVLLTPEKCKEEERTMVTGRSPLKNKIHSRKDAWLYIVIAIILTVNQIALAELSPIPVNTPPTLPKIYNVSEDDAERYKGILQRARDNKPLWITRLFPTLEEKAAEWSAIKESLGDEEYYGIKHGLPVGNVVSEEHAVFLAYSALEDRFGYDDTTMSVYYPDMTYDITEEDAPVWRIRLVPYGQKRYGSYRVNIDARNGAVLSLRAPEDPRG